MSWILPSQAESEHAGGSSTAHGANFTSRILAALTSNPEVWSKTVFFITFDENDGWFDHVPPPAVPSYNPDGSLAGMSTIDTSGMYFDATGVNHHVNRMRVLMRETISGAGEHAWAFQSETAHYIDPRDTTSGMVRPLGMGPRVPLYIVSPWTKGGWVSSEVFDHTSVGQFLEQRFGVTIPAISPWHRAVSGDLTSAFDFASPNDPQFPTLPATAGWEEIEQQQKKMPAASAPETLTTFEQEPGTRPSRPTPYELHVTAQVDRAGKVTLRFGNTGKKGAVFHVYDRKHLDRIPRRYTVEAGKRLHDSAWNAAVDGGVYDLEVHSTNGFFRSFKGNTKTGAAIEVNVDYDVAGGNVRAELKNSGASPIEARIAANAYRAGAPETISVAPNATAQRLWPVGDSGNWYDFTVSASGFERRFAGRMENGGNLISDPAMAIERFKGRSS